MRIFDVSIRTSFSPRIKGRNHRRGLAPLEMVLVLPMFIMIMSMIIVFGYLISWKLRTETVSRDAIWRDRNDRFANRDALQPEWPTSAVIATQPGQDILTMDIEPVVNHPIIAGPIPNVVVRDELLDYRSRVREGIASIERSPPIFASLTTINFRVVHSLLDNQFRYWQLGHGNFRRRIPEIYEIELDFIRNSAEFQAAVLEIENAPFQPQLDALDRDQEFIDWYSFAFDFHPRIGSFCESDPESVLEIQVNGIVQRITGLPRQMARRSIQLYQEQLLSDRFSDAERLELQRKIDALQSWLSTI